MERPWETSKVDVPKDHFDLLFTPVACVVSITTDTTDRVNAASFATCVRVHHEPTCIAFCVDSHQFGHPMRTPPGTPMDRVRILREAYSNAMRDPELIAEAQKARGVIEPVSGENLVVAKRVMVQSASGRAVQKDFARRDDPEPSHLWSCCLVNETDSWMCCLQTYLEYPLQSQGIRIALPHLTCNKSKTNHMTVAMLGTTVAAR